VAGVGSVFGSRRGLGTRGGWLGRRVGVRCGSRFGRRRRGAGVGVGDGGLGVAGVGMRRGR
jgi:hypothetical protein